MEEVDRAILQAVERGDRERAAVLIFRHVSPTVRVRVHAWLKHDVRSAMDAEDQADDVTQEASIALPWDECDARALINEMLEHLDRREHILLSMRLERMETAAIAAALGITEGNVRTIESRATAKLRALFTQNEDGRLVLDRAKLATKPGGRRRRKG
jgi:DNA-directed RNA polymerase specialized sigma24 family protein